MSEVVYLNGRLIKTGQAWIAPSDQGFLYGAGVFETMRTYNGCIFLLDRHLERLVSSAHVIGLANIDPAGLKEACCSVVASNRLGSARVRLTVSRGRLSPFTSISGTPTILVQAQRYEPPGTEKYRLGYRAVLSTQPRYSKSMLVRHKTTNYLECLLARAQALGEGNDEALFINEAGNLTEGTASNLFLADRDGTLFTPPLDAGLLPGITRRFMLELAAKIGIEIIETNISQIDLKNFSEVFVTSSLIEVMPIASIKGSDGREYSFDRQDTAHRFQGAYREAVRQECGRHDQ